MLVRLLRRQHASLQLLVQLMDVSMWWSLAAFCKVIALTRFSQGVHHVLGGLFVRSEIFHSPALILHFAAKLDLLLDQVMLDNLWCAAT